MSKPLGDKLREAREAKGMSVEQLSSVTRINVKFIEALEAGRRDKLPGQVYLKPFVKTCAEALGLDLKELYRLINGEMGEADGEEAESSDKPKKRRRFDYKLIVVLLVAAAVCVAIYLAMNAREKMPPKTRIVEVVPAEVTLTKREAKWSRPWERPSSQKTVNLRQNLVLMASDSVGVLLISAGDTVFNAIMAGGERRVFSSPNDFVISLTRNERVTGFLNGKRDSTLGASQGKLDGYKIGKEKR